MTLKEIWKEYEAFAPTSKKQHEEAVGVLPGGVAANNCFWLELKLSWRT